MRDFSATKENHTSTDEKFFSNEQENSQQPTRKLLTTDEIPFNFWWENFQQLKKNHPACSPDSNQPAVFYSQATANKDPLLAKRSV